MGETIFPNEYYATITNLHQEGYLQHLEYLEPPEFLDEDDKNATNYHTALLEFRDTLEDITVTDAVCKNIKTECLIAPASMQLFSSLKKVTFRESSRINLCGMRDYIANCGSTVKSFNFSMRGKTSTPLQVDYNDQHPTYPRENVQKLCIDLDTSLETAELSFIMCTFPSPQDFTFEISEDFEQDLVVQHHDLEVAVQFFRYLAHIPEVTCQSLWFDVSQGLDLLSHLVNFMDIQIVSIDCKASTDRGTGLALALYTPYITTATKTESFHAIINIYSNETHASFIKAFEGLKGESIKQITIGPTYNYSKSLLQKVQQPLIDYILDNYGGLQDLTFAGVEFPSPTPCSAIQRVKQLQKLHIDKCSITEDYFARLSYHFEKIGCLKFTHFELHDADPTASGAKEKTNIYMPYTAVDTFDLTMYVSSLILKAWANYNYIVLKWAGTGFIVAEANDTNSTPGAYEVTIHCASLKQISILDTVFKLP